MSVVTKKAAQAQTISFDAPEMKETEEIIFSIGESDIGCVLVARTNAGICSILMGANGDELRGELSSRFPDSMLVRNDETVRSDLEKVTRLIATPSEPLDLPLDIRGTRFQRRVWEALLTVRPGAVITYAALARRIGEPNAVRAVAQACANNPLAVAIPCHRVVRVDGALGGYRWGIERKRALIKREALA